MITSLSVLLGSLLGFKAHQMVWMPRTWSGLTLRGIGCRLKINWPPGLDPKQSYVFACNHSSAVDIPVLQVSLPRNFRWISKQELLNIPVFGHAMRAMGYIGIDRGDGRKAMLSLSGAARQIAEGASVIIFPEGTRSEDGNLLPFKTGAFRLAIKSGRPVVPVYVRGTGKVLPPKTYDLRPGRIEVNFGSPIPTEGLTSNDKEELTELTRQKILELKAQSDLRAAAREGASS